MPDLETAGPARARPHFLRARLWRVPAAVPAKKPVLQRVIDFWEAKQVLAADVFYALLDEERAAAFSIKGDLWADLISDAYASLGKALQEGVTIGQWARDLWPQIAARYGPDKNRQLSGRLVTIYRTNVQAGYAAGRYAIMFRPDVVALAPYVQYHATPDDRTRPEHRALDGKVWRKDDLSARAYFPPLGFACRCTLQELSEKQVRDRSLTPSSGADLPLDPAIGQPDPGWDTDRVAALVPRALSQLPPPLRPPADTNP